MLYIVMYRHSKQASSCALFALEISESPQSLCSVDVSSLPQLSLMLPLITVISLELLPGHCTYSVGVCLKVEKQPTFCVYKSQVFSLFHLGSL